MNRWLSGGRRALYLVVSYTRAHGHVIRPGLTLVAAVRLVEQLGHGAVFRSEGLSPYSRPVYPKLPRTPGGAAAVTSAADDRGGVRFRPQRSVA